MKILDIEVDWMGNAKRIAREHWLYVLMATVTMVADSVSTTLFMSVDGIESEMNLAVRLLALRMGIVAGPALAKTLQLAALFLLGCFAIRLARLLCWVVIGINVVAVARNMQHYWLCLQTG